MDDVESKEFLGILLSLNETDDAKESMSLAEFRILLLLYKRQENKGSVIRMSKGEMASILGYKRVNSIAFALKKLISRGQVRVGEQGPGTPNTYRLTYKRSRSANALSKIPKRTRNLRIRRGSG